MGGKKWCVARCSHHGGGGPQPGQPTMGATVQRTNGPEKAIPPLTVRNQQFRRKREGKGTPRSTLEHDQNSLESLINTRHIWYFWRGELASLDDPPHERRDENKSSSPALLLHFSRTRTSRHFTEKQRLVEYGERVAIRHRRRTLPHTLPLTDVYTRHKSERRAFSSTKQ